MIDDLFLPHPVPSSRDELIAELRRRPFHPGMYHEFTIPKASGGVRQILAPNPDLMRLLDGLLDLLHEQKLPGSQCAHAYYFGRSILTMATPHLRRRVVVKLDLSDFFPTITRRLVRAALDYRRVPPPLVNLVLRWCFHEDRLPIGAPTSPLLSNLVAADNIDRRLVGLARTWRRTTKRPADWRHPDIAYTRYADDLVFSSDYDDLPKIVPAVRRILESTAFRLNEKKIRILRRSRRQTVCGVVVNSEPGAPRSARRALKHELFRYACDIAAGRCPPGRRIERMAEGGFPQELPLDFARLAGRIAHVRWLKPSHAASLQPWFDLLVDLHRPETNRAYATRRWCASFLRRQETACSPTSVPEIPPASPSSTATSPTS